MTGLLQIRADLEAAPFHFAKTMPHIPHFWTAKRDWSAEEFDACARAIQEHGQLERFKHFAPKRYLYLGQWRYWTMSEPGVSTIINRCDPKHPKLAPHIKPVT